ncbi:MAG: PfkB family carbohydrate kinase [Acutalibacteraceae bacterium]
MKHYDSMIIGHITKDFNIDHEGNQVEICGGAVLYSSASAYALGHKVAAVTRLAKSDYDRLEQFTIPKEDVYVIPSKSSTTMKNQYFTADKERRACTCLSLGDHFETDDIPKDASADIYHFAGLIYGDYPNELIKKCADLGKVAVDVQTCLRHADMEDNGRMYFEDWADKKEMLPYVTFLKTDAAEAEILTGCTDRLEAAKILHSWGAKEILITHNTEVLAYDGENAYTCPIKARNLSGRTGRGDTTFAAYINERLNKSMEEALLYATAIVSLKMETPGVFKGTKADIESYIEQFYK